MSGLLEWVLFLALSGVAVAMAAGMLLTMSMYRAGLALMSSFVALAGLFLLLDADLLAAVQVMMNVGGMLVMILFMVMMMMDPGGESMWGMKRDMNIPGPGALSMTMPRSEPEEPSGEDSEGMHHEGHEATTAHEGHGGMDHDGGHGGMAHHGDHGDMAHHEGHGSTEQQGHHDMMVDMAMSTAQLPWALAIGVSSAVALLLVVVVTPWLISSAAPTRPAAEAVGELLLSRYMIGFEGAAFLILAGIAGAVILGKREGGER